MNVNVRHNSGYIIHCAFYHKDNPAINVRFSITFDCAFSSRWIEACVNVRPYLPLHLNLAYEQHVTTCPLEHSSFHISNAQQLERDIMKQLIIRLLADLNYNFNLTHLIYDRKQDRGDSLIVRSSLR